MASDGSQLSYNATGQQTRALHGRGRVGGYDGERQRVKKVEGGQATYYLRSTVLGGQVVAEYNQSGAWTRGYVYDGNAQLLAMQAGEVQWVHQDPITKSKRVTNRQGEFLSAIDVDPWGGETSRMANGGALSRKYTTYERDGNGRDQAMARSYSGWFSRFDQPDPFDGSYDLTNPQSFNRYAYVGNDPVNFVDPTGLCTFNIALSFNNQLTTDQRSAMRAEITRIFQGAGHQINFVSTNADYYLSVNANATGYTTNRSAVGITYLNGRKVTNNGRVFVGRLTTSATDDDASETAFNQDANAVGTGLGRAGAHEIGHFLLQQNYDSSAIQGVMKSGFRGTQWFSNTTQTLWTFTAGQVARLNSLCAPVPNDASPHSPVLTDLGSSVDSRGGRIVGGRFGGITTLDILVLNLLRSGYTEWVSFAPDPVLPQ